MLEMLENISIKPVNYGMNIDGINAKFEHIRKQVNYKNERRELEQGIPGDPGDSGDVLTQVPVDRTEKAASERTPGGGEGASGWVAKAAVLGLRQVPTAGPVLTPSSELMAPQSWDEAQGFVCLTSSRVTLPLLI